MQLSFGDTGQRIYVVDTSALITLDFIFPKQNIAFTAIWEEIEDLMSHGQFRTLNFVEDEINSYEGDHTFLKEWIHNFKKNFVVETDEDCYNAAIPIISTEYSTGFFDPKKQAEGKEEADPYLIAYCKINNYILITSESKTRANKIPAVAKKHGVDCIDINDFLTERGLKMERRKKKED